MALEPGLKRDDIVAEARRWIGTPYRHQGSQFGVGCDCLGLVRGVWRALIGDEPERAPAYSADWAEGPRTETMLEAAGRHLQPVPLSEVQAGDVLLFRWRPDLPVKHAAIFIGEARIVHAYDAAGRVAETALAEAWRKRLAAAFAFPGAV